MDSSELRDELQKLKDSGQLRANPIIIATVHATRRDSKMGIIRGAGSSASDGGQCPKFSPSMPRGLRKTRQGRGASAEDNTHHRKRRQGRHGMSSHLERLDRRRLSDRRPGRMSTPTFLSDPANQGEIRGEILQPDNRPHRVIRDLGPLTRSGSTSPTSHSMA